MAFYHVPFNGLRADNVSNPANLEFVEDAVMETRIADSLSAAGVDALTKLTKTGVLVSGDLNLARMVGNVISGDFTANRNSAPNIHTDFAAATNVVPIRRVPFVGPSTALGGAMHLAA